MDTTVPAKQPVKTVEDVYAALLWQEFSGLKTTGIDIRINDKKYLKPGMDRVFKLAETTEVETAGKSDNEIIVDSRITKTLCSQISEVILYDIRKELQSQNDVLRKENSTSEEIKTANEIIAGYTNRFNKADADHDGKISLAEAMLLNGSTYFGLPHDAPILTPSLPKPAANR